MIHGKKTMIKVKLKRQLTSILVKNLGHDELKELREIFEKFDKDHSGDLSEEELKNAIIYFNESNEREAPSQAELNAIMKNIDHN